MKKLIIAAKEARRYFHLLTVSIISTIILTLINLSAPYILSRGVDLISSGLNDDSLKTLIRITLTLLTLYGLRVLFRFLSGYLSHVAAWKLVQELRVRIYEKLQMLSPSYYKDKQSGDIVSRIMSDTENFERLYAHIIPEILTNILTLIGVSTILFFLNWNLALITFLTVPPLLYSGYFFSKKVRPCFRRSQKAKGVLSSALFDNISGMREIQIFTQDARSSKDIHSKAQDVTEHLLKSLKLSGIFHPSVEFITSLGIIIVIGAGGYLSQGGYIQTSDIIAFLLYLSLFYAPVRGISQLLENTQLTLASVERVMDILDEPLTIADKEDALILDSIRGDVFFRGVTFSYNDNIPLIEDLSFMAKKGQTIALVGTTGAGKTTLTNLMCRFYDPLDGSIMIDGIDIKNIALKNLRSHISVVLQDTFLFNGTVRDNIAFVDPHAPFDRILHAAKVACIHDDIMKMENGYDTIIGERGLRLSGGQKQRISLARALLKDSEILILDEATASIDMKTERIIQKSLESLYGEKTIIVIAHRLSTIKNADTILFIHNGNIVESGSHSELIEFNGMYKNLWMSQEESIKV